MTEKKPKNDLLVTVVDIKGKCPVYRLGNRILLEEGYRLNLEETDAVCMHSLASLMPYYNALFHGVSAAALGLGRKDTDDKGAYLQCSDPCGYTGGGTVVFYIEVVSGNR